MRLLAMGIVGLSMLGFFAYLATRLTAPDFALLYGNLPPDESGEIVSQLESMGVPYQLAANGTQILVPGDQVLRLRVGLAEQGLPSGGSIGYEVFDDGSSLGTTSFVQNVNLLRAIEGELGRTIGALDPVRSARVHVVLPRRELFQRDGNEPTASVFLRLRSGNLGPSLVAAIQHLVAAAVPGLETNRVAIVDGRGNLLASGEDNGDEVGVMATRAAEYQRNVERQFKQTIEQLIQQSVGPGKVRAEVAAEINFDRTTINEELYDPDGQVVRSTQTIEDSANSTEGDEQVSVGNNLPDSDNSEGGIESQTSSLRTEETVNFEISRTIRNQIQETGSIERLSIAVLVDGIYSVNAETEERTYQPRGDEELQQIEALVRSAVGFDEKRGDTIEVANLQFAEIDELPAEDVPLLGLSKTDYFKIAEIVVLAIVAILVILLVLRPMVSRILAGVAEGRAQAAAVLGQPAAAPGQPQLAAPTGDPALAAAPAAQLVAPADEVEPESMIDISKVEGRVRASSVRKIGEIIDKHPDEALTILRGWMTESPHN